MDQSDGFNTFVNRNTESDSTVGNSVQHSVAGTVGNEACSPFLCTAEVTLTDQAGSFFTFGNSNFFAVDNNLTVTRSDTAPGHAPSSQFTDSFRSSINEHTNDFLVCTPVGTANGVAEVDILIVADALNHISQRGLHTALSGFGVGTFRGN